MTIPKKSRYIVAVFLLIAITYTFLSYQSNPANLEVPFVEIDELTIQIVTEYEDYSLGDTVKIEVYAFNDQSNSVRLLPQTTEDFNIVYLNDPNAISEIAFIDYFNSTAREKDSILIPAGQRTLLDTKTYKIKQTGIIRINFLETIKDITIPPNINTVETASPVVLEGLVCQEDDPYHDWESDPTGPKVKSLDVMDPKDNLSIQTYILADPDGQLFRFFPVEERVPGPIWDYVEPKPVTIYGFVKQQQGINNQTFKVLYVYDIRPSELGEWVTGEFSSKTQNTGLFTFYNRTFGGDFTFLTLKTSEEELVLASHEGYVYNVPICGTSQPIAECRFNETITVRGLRTMVTDSRGQNIPTFMVFEVK